MKNNEGFLFIGDVVEEVKEFNKVTNHILSFLHASVSIENDWRAGEKMNIEAVSHPANNAKIDPNDFKSLTGISKVSRRSEDSSPPSSRPS
jgi:hypothetical protein